MSEILLGHADGRVIGATEVNAMFRFRKQVFQDLLGWEVDSREGMERDAFDDLDPVYMIARTPQYQIQGCWRLLPTTGPYMLRDVFPELLEGQAVPCAPDVWELSRLAVLPTEQEARERGSMCPVTLRMFRAVTEFAQRNGIRRYVFVTSVGVERMLKRMGVPLARFGTGKAVRLGKVLSVVLWVEVNAQLRRAVGLETEQAPALPLAA